MATVSFILGLCGSGKSHIASLMSGVHVIDESFFNRTNELVAAIRAGKDCAVIEIAFCRKEARELIERELIAIDPGVRINWICIENDLPKANRNCRRSRKDKEAGSEEKHVAINEFYSPLYSYPPGAEIHAMWPFDESGQIEQPLPISN